MKVISFGAQKGGTGKSTGLVVVSRCLAQHLIEQGSQKKVLVIDLDNIGSTTTVFEPSNLAEQDPLGTKHSAQAFLSEKNLQEFIVKSNYEGIDLVPNHSSLRSLNFSPLQVKNRVGTSGLEDIYEYVFIDTPATYYSLHIAVFLASDIIVTPVNLSIFDSKPLQQMKDWLLKDTGRNDNWRLFLSKVSPHASDEQMGDYMDFFSKIGKEHFFKTVIPDSQKLKNAIDYKYFISQSKKYAALHAAICGLASEIAGEEIRVQGRF